jgi:uncharacterized protein (TIGR03067 family)
MPESCKAELVPAAGENAKLFETAGSGTPAKAPLTTAFLQSGENTADKDALQGKWRMSTINMEGKEHTKEELQRRAAARGQDAKMFDMGLEFRGMRVKWTGSTTGESIIIGMDARKKPRQLRLLSVSNGKDEQFAIYDLQADTLRYCFSSSPPRKFESIPKKAQLSIVFVREGGPKQ